MTEEASSAAYGRMKSAAQGHFKPVLMKTRTRVIERTDLETDGENWRGRCSCGWTTPIFRRRKTAERHVNSHYESRDSAY